MAGDTSADQISIEAAQPKLDLGVLRDLSGKKIMLGVLDLGNPEIETTEIVADRIRRWGKEIGFGAVAISASTSPFKSRLVTQIFAPFVASETVTSARPSASTRSFTVPDTFGNFPAG